MEDQTYEIACDGTADLFFDNKDRMVINPSSLNEVFLKHTFDPKSKGVVFVITEEALKERGIYIIDQIAEYNGEERIKVRLFSYGKRSFEINEKDVICTLILNELEEAND